MIEKNKENLDQSSIPPIKISCREDQLTVKSIAAFSCFLSCCVGGLVPCSTTENDALFELLEASDDHHLRLAVLRETIAGKGELCGWNLEAVYNRRDRKYWARRFFTFLKSLSELKAVPRDEKRLFSFQDFSC
eukprot:gene146-147_t